MKFDYTITELFAGVGGFRLGFERASKKWETVFANQWEPGKSKQHAYNCYIDNIRNDRFNRKNSIHWEEKRVTNEDIATYANAAKQLIPDHTVLVGGFPCQDYSVARTKADGIAGKKGVLFWEIDKIVAEKQPPFVLLENVDRLLKSPSKQRGRDFGVMLKSFQKRGYGVEWRMINAADYGYAQKRRRVFIFAFHKDTQYFKERQLTDKAVLLHSEGYFQSQFPVEDESSTRHLPLSTELHEDIVDLSDNFSFRFRNSGIMIDGHIYSEEVLPKSPRKQITLGDILEKGVEDEKYYLGEQLEDWEYMKGPKKVDRVTSEGYHYQYSEGGMAFPDHLDRPGRTILTSESSKNRSTHVVRDPESGRLRILTPVECERMNGFPDNWTDSGMPHKFRYFCMGNALVVNLVEKMAKELKIIVDNEVKHSKEHEGISNLSFFENKEKIN
ncbi:5-methylcytosine methyltransferase [Pontibacillus halophilus JSM 076056 = DSM 19796]|uniref:DNA (cytosine-5-)-methyltransferase n=1 Tax=Pontibacillus halophilus JSM 076056 = DSM 19796 TaxID=1385510 RepID=A0A0A5GFC5_9BACI|nr:DNA (cytosine-5-)-methyltransferase [Pontibacillus halophilus]KGX89825.1 5-methylcytosine methyltransferase [Pontibacillus halophilus JSM 076056 = DSM 19796]